MLQKVFSIRVGHKADMSKLEEVVVGLLGGEHHRCSFLRSGEYQRLRTLALYGNGGRHMENFASVTVHLEGLRITLTPTRIACVYLTDACVVPVPDPPTTSTAMAKDDEQHVLATLAGKRRRAISPFEAYTDELDDASVKPE